jgi:NitT/TauT family transport system permease protein
MQISEGSAAIYDSDAERSVQKKYRRGVIIGQLTLVLAVLALWQFGSGRLFDPFFVGSPSGVANILLKDLFDSHFYADLAVTGLEMAWGYALGVVLGVGLAVIFARWRLMADVFDPFFSALNSLPRIALAPLLVIWFGIDMASKAVLAATLVFFLMFFTTLSGIRNIDPALIDLARLVGATKRQIFQFIILPGASVWVINGLKVSLPYALIGVIVGEFIISSSGLGYRLNAYSTAYNTNGTFAMLLVMMALMMALNAIVSAVERRLLRWRADLGSTITY